MQTFAHMDIRYGVGLLFMGVVGVSYREREKEEGRLKFHVSIVKLPLPPLRSFRSRSRNGPPFFALHRYIIIVISEPHLNKVMIIPIFSVYDLQGMRVRVGMGRMSLFSTRGGTHKGADIFQVG